MFDNAQLDKMIIFALIGIVAILVVAVIALAVKRNIYYVDENGNEIKPNKKKPAVNGQPVHPAPQKMTPLQADPLPQNYDKAEPLEVKGSAVAGALVSVTINGNTSESEITAFPCLMGRETSSCNLV
jgi:hypothetical protein